MRRLPLTRGDCIGGPRPCPFVECRHHLDSDKSVVGRLRGGPTCSLDVADEGGHTLEELGDILGVVRERIRQIESLALRRANSRSWMRTVSREDLALFAHPRGVTEVDQ